MIGPWRTGRQMALISRPHLINSTVYHKLYHRCTTGDITVCDTTSITRQVKSWLYSDLLEKQEKNALHRNIEDGGLGLQNIEIQALLFLIEDIKITETQDDNPPSLIPLRIELSSKLIYLVQTLPAPAHQSI